MAVTDVLPLDEFVDLYKILDISESASEAELRERVNQLYLEAQRNIDHHNFRKRFYYQQLYEVHLPQAHQLLLDAARRAEYDRFLDAFNKGEPFPEDVPGAGSGDTVTAGELGRTDSLADDMIPTMGGESAALPATLAPSATPPPAAPAKPAATPAKPAPRPATPAPPPKPITPAKPATPVAPKRTAPVSPSISASAGRRVAVDIEDMERRRDHKRRELIKGELEAAGQTWGYGVGIVVFIFILTIAYFAGGGQITMLAGGAVLGLTSGLIAGRYALRAARRNIVVVLSKMPYDELLRRCAR